MNIAQYASLRQTAFENLKAASPKQNPTHAQLIAEIERLLRAAP
jgi:hypothetical protein